MKVQRFAKLQHTGSLCSQLSPSVTTSTQRGQSETLCWLQNRWQPALAAEEHGIFFKISLHVSMYGCLCTCMCMHFCPLISMASKTRNLRTRPLRPEVAPLNISISFLFFFSTNVISQKEIMMAADVTANVFPSVHLSKMLIFRGYFHIVNRRTL